MRSLIIDDEEPGRARLKRLLAAHPEIEVAGEARDGLEAVERIEALQPDLLFLDIELPGLSGFEVLDAIPESVPAPLVIFVTGYDQHALAAFDANALAYLLKPVEPERLAQAVDRARKLSASAGKLERERVLRVAREAPKTLRQIVCRKRDRAVLLRPEQVIWFQVEDGVVKAHTASDTFWVNYQLRELEENLPAELFFRARRETLVNLRELKEIRPYFKSGFLLIMADAGATEIVVSERQARSLRQRIPGL
ncbi:MAG TPA: LytTR family DNA-binding domain-containing protein [Bryobacteraceae bacterium]|jgi:two-component system, LytTR family, response regulator|nr:LytTR family DNA-binding domain-containing protein [Bryobacteraceae bacterium]